MPLTIKWLLADDKVRSRGEARKRSRTCMLFTVLPVHTFWLKQVHF